jgi:hypothetical protein
MAKWILAALLLPAAAWAGTLKDVPYSFDPRKVKAADTSLEFVRSFADYYYLLMQANTGGLETLNKLGDTPGWCAGDAHPENFGALIGKDGSSLFAIDDIDDAGPCPLAMDLFRFLLTAQMSPGQMHLHDLLAAYSKGLAQDKMREPAVLTEILKKSADHGQEVDKKEVDGRKLVRNSETRELSQAEREILNATLAETLSFHFTVLDQVEKQKDSGGSAFLPRFEVLVEEPNGLLHLEFKTQVQPAVAAVSDGKMPAQKQRITRTLQLEQQGKASPLQRFADWNGTPMFMRPRYAGIIEVKLKKLKDGEVVDLLEYEAYELGRLHAQTAPKDWADRVKKLDHDAVKDDLLTVQKHFEQLYRRL